MKNAYKKISCLLLALTISFGVVACGGKPNRNSSGGNGGDSSSSSSRPADSSSQGGNSSVEDSSSSEAPVTPQETPYLPNGMPDYDAITGVDEFIFNSYYSPKVSRAAFQEYKDCGFNWVNLCGNTWFPSTTVEDALSIADDLGLKVLVNVSEAPTMMNQLASTYLQYDSFQGYYFDEPFMDVHTGYNNRLGLIQLETQTRNLVASYPSVSFCVNLNPIWYTDSTYSNPTYEQYVNAMMTKINAPYQDVNSKARKWLSADDYPFWYNKSANTKYLATDWLKGLAYLARAKSDSDMDNLVSNFFIQSMAFGTGNKSRNRPMYYKEMKMQLYTLMAFGYDSASFFCYYTPPVVTDGEFTADQFALIDRKDQKTQTYHDAKTLMTEVKKFQHTYMQFNDNWRGVYTVVGSGSSSRADFTDLANFDGVESLTSPIVSSSKRKRMGLTSATATRDTVIGCMEDDYGNAGFVVVNYNDTIKNYSSQVDMQFDAAKFSKAWVYIDGQRSEVALSSGKLTLSLDVGEGVFVIPILNR